MRRIGKMILAGVLILNLSIPVYADRSEKKELPETTTDYYMTVDSGGIGVDIYSETSDKGDALNDSVIKDGTVLHIQGETEKDGETWGYTEYQGGYGYVPLDELRPSKDSELVAAGVKTEENNNSVTASPTEAESTESTPAESKSTSMESAPAESAPTESTPAESASMESAPAESAPTESAPTESAPTEAASTESTSEESTPTESAQTESSSTAKISPVSEEESVQADSKRVNGTKAKSFKTDSTRNYSPFVWIGVGTVLAAAVILGYHVKKRK